MLFQYQPKSQSRSSYSATMEQSFQHRSQTENCEAQIFYDRIGRQEDYQIAFGSWFADFHDPINFLEVFKYKNNKTNNTNSGKIPNTPNY